MNIVCIGGGPAGLYFAISAKLRNPEHDIVVVERNRPDDTFGWGVVLSDQTLDNLTANDPQSAERIHDSFAHWDDIDIYIKDQVVTSGGHGFSGIARMRLLQLLQERCLELGVKLQFETNVEDLSAYTDADLIIAADGINSPIRKRYQDYFKPDIEVRSNRFIWYGTTQIFDAFTFIFKQTEHGWIWAHAYRFDQNTSTFIVECSEQTWRGLQLDSDDQNDSITRCQNLFADHLNDHPLLSNANHLRGSAWLNFNRVSCVRWHHNNIILMGDAAHTAHFSIGSGTKLALEDAITLADYLHSGDFSSMPEAISAYQNIRQLEVLKLQSAARNSTQWFENIPRYARFEPMQFAYSLLTRSQRISHENLRLRDPNWLAQVERWFAARTEGGSGSPAPPMFVPLQLLNMELKNRIVVSPMSMYSAEDGTPGDFHLVHYGARAQGGAGLIYTEMTNVCREGRITPGCAGLYKDEHIDAWRRIVNFIHSSGDTRIAVQLGHAGPKGSTRVAWEGIDQPLTAGNWELIAPSAIPWSAANQIPTAMTRADMDMVVEQFVLATERALECGFDMVELHAAHGYLLSAFITPLSNQRNDDYGGSLNNRLRFPVQVFSAMRAVWPQDKPMAVRVSAHDWIATDPGNDTRGINPDDAVEIAKAFKVAGANIIDVSAGQTSALAQPVYGRMFQTPFADQIRNEADIATMAVGNIYEIDHVNSILAAGRADLCCLGRPHLADPYWTLRAAAQQGYNDISWPVQYQSGAEQLARNIRRQAELTGHV